MTKDAVRDAISAAVKDTIKAAVKDAMFLHLYVNVQSIGCIEYDW